MSTLLGTDRRFTTLCLAQSVSTLGNALTSLTLILLINQRTGSVVAIAGLTVVLAVPAIGFGLFAGAWVDRWNRRTVMVLSDATRAVLLAGLAVGTFAGSALWLVYLIAFAQAGVGTLFDPARAALFQEVVPADEQMRANSVQQTGIVLGELAGTTLAGVFAATLHAVWLAFAIDAVTFVVSVLLVGTVRVTWRPSDEDRPSTVRAIADGLRAVRDAPVLRGLLLVFAGLTFALSPLAVLLTPYVVDTLHISVGWIGVIQSGDTVGNIVGAVTIAVLARRVRARPLIIGGMLALGALVAAIAGIGSVLGLVLAYFVFGLLTVAIQTGIGALSQTEVANALMGRFVSLMSITPSVVSVLAMAGSGTVAAIIGVRAMFVCAGAVLVLFAVVSARSLAANRA